MFNGDAEWEFRGVASLKEEPAVAPTSSRKKSFVPAIEALKDRLVPSVTFIENTSTITNNGNGGLSITADGTNRSFTSVTEVQVNTYDGTDTVTYNQGTSAGEVDLLTN